MLGKFFKILPLVLFAIFIVGCQAQSPSVKNDKTKAPINDTKAPAKEPELIIPVKSRQEFDAWMKKTITNAMSPKIKTRMNIESEKINLTYQGLLPYNKDWPCQLEEGTYLLKGLDKNNKQAIALIIKTGDNAYLGQSDVLDGAALPLVCIGDKLELDKTDNKVRQAIKAFATELNKV